MKYTALAHLIFEGDRVWVQEATPKFLEEYNSDEYEGPDTNAYADPQPMTVEEVVAHILTLAQQSLQREERIEE